MKILSAGIALWAFDMGMPVGLIVNGTTQVSAIQPVVFYSLLIFSCAVIVLGALVKK